MSALDHTRDHRQSITDNSFEVGFNFEKNCFTQINTLPPVKQPEFLYSRSWQKWNKAVNFPLV